MALSCSACGFANTIPAMNPVQLYNVGNGQTTYMHKLCAESAYAPQPLFSSSSSGTMHYAGTQHNVDLSQAQAANSPAPSATSVSKRSKIEDIRECSTCGTEFSRKYDYQRHMNSVHGEGNYVCNISPCEDKPFARKDHLQRHERNFHNMR